MNTIPSSRLARIVYIDAVLFAIHLITYFIPAIRNATYRNSLPLAEFDALLAVAEHLLLFPIVAALPAPRWGKAAGYGWLVVDMATDIMQLNGVPALIYLTLRYGGHISSALWAASASWQARGALRVVGLLYALDLTMFSFMAFVPLSFVVLLPSLVLLPLWLVLIGRLLARHGIEEGQQRLADDRVGQTEIR